MFVQVTVRVDGREVANLDQTIDGKAADAEEQTQCFGRRIECVILECAFSQVAEGVRRPVCCGHPMESRGRRCRTVQTLSGEVVVQRKRYRCRFCRAERVPADEQICCGCHRITRPLAQRLCQLATVEHFTRLEQLLADQHGVHLGHEEILEVVHDVGEVAERRRRAEAESWQDSATGNRGWPEPMALPSRVYVSCDGIMYCTNQGEPDPQDPQRRRLIWQQMKVGCVYWEDESGHWHKQMTWGRESPEEFGAALFRLACGCGYRQASERIFAADGADWCWEIRARYFGDATGILDWYHVSEHIWATGHALHADAGAAHNWVDEALKRLREQGGRSVISWLEHQRQSFRRQKRTNLLRLRAYLELRAHLQDYPRYRQKGWQIGTGMIESTAKQLVGVRLKGPGMHWTEAGALAITALRAQDLNGRWHAFWNSLALAA
jgi:hypothetical protein